MGLCGDVTAGIDAHGKPNNMMIEGLCQGAGFEFSGAGRARTLAKVIHAL
jgi:hypothetical protein